MADAKITPEVRDVLTRSTITGNVLALPPGQLDRKLYEAVNKVLVNAGGKWKTGKGHVFPFDPRPKLGLALETGVARDEKKALQAFYTPAAIAARVVQLAEVSGKTVLEPSCGEGALALECQSQGAQFVYAFDINPKAVDVLQAKLSPRISTKLVDDFLTQKPSEHGLVDRVVMNPPFTKNQDVEHVAHALRFLSDGGRLVAIMSPNTERKCFAELVSRRDYVIHQVEAGAFKESGTPIATIILVINNQNAPL